MICPTDNQPCTWDHSEECYRNCNYMLNEARLKLRRKQARLDRAKTEGIAGTDPVRYDLGNDERGTSD